MTDLLNISSFGTMVHYGADADLMKLLERLASKRSALTILQGDATGPLKATAFGTSNE
jgi:hypothetical protein